MAENGKQFFELGGAIVGLAFLPWERLPAYVFGPLFCALNIWLFFIDEKPTVWHWVLYLVGVAFGLWVVWSRYKTGVEPLWSEEQREKARKRNEESK